MGKNTEKKQKKTVRQLYKELNDVPLQAKDRVIKALDVSSAQVFYDVINGRRKLNTAEKTAIAEIFNQPVDDIDWLDQPSFIA